MLRSDIPNKPMAAKPNPAIAFAANFQREKLLLEIDGASIAVVEAEKAERTAMDAYLLALAARSALKRRNDPERPLSDEEYAPVQAEVDRADKARVRSNELANQVRGKLQRLLKRNGRREHAAQ